MFVCASRDVPACVPACSLVFVCVSRDALGCLRVHVWLCLRDVSEYLRDLPCLYAARCAWLPAWCLRCLRDVHGCLRGPSVCVCIQDLDVCVHCALAVGAAMCACKTW
jgi:hypothetical protein